MTTASFSMNRNWLKGVIKFVVALAIPAGIAWFFIQSQEKARIEVENYEKEQKLNPTVESVVIKDYELKEIDDFNHIKWHLTAKEGKMAPNNKDVFLDSVVVEYYDGPNVKMKIVAPTGTANQDTKYVKLTAGSGRRVEAEGDGGKSKFIADTVELTKKNQFLASGGVIINWSEVAKVTGNSATGTIDKTGINQVKVIGNTHAIINMK